jgi:hypothetical protein
MNHINKIEISEFLSDNGFFYVMDMETMKKSVTQLSMQEK